MSDIEPNNNPSLDIDNKESNNDPLDIFNKKPNNDPISIDNKKSNKNPIKIDKKDHNNDSLSIDNKKPNKNPLKIDKIDTNNDPPSIDNKKPNKNPINIDKKDHNIYSLSIDNKKSNKNPLNINKKDPYNDPVSIDNKKPNKDNTLNIDNKDSYNDTLCIDNKKPNKDDTLNIDNKELSKSVLAQIERNRQKALLIRQENASKRIYKEIELQNKYERGNNCKIPRSLDSHGGFLLEPNNNDASNSFNIIQEPGPVLEREDKLYCEECKKSFLNSFLMEKFDKSVCDSCRDATEKHRLITKTDAKEQYLLKDVDIDLREPILKYILKRNPHKKSFGDMKLYLECQVVDRALELWKSDENLEAERNKREGNKERVKKKKFDRKIEDLRKSVRGSLYKKAATGHEHDFGQEVYNEREDNYCKTCESCGHKITFEKM